MVEKQKPKRSSRSQSQAEPGRASRGGQSTGNSGTSKHPHSRNKAKKGSSYKGRLFRSKHPRPSAAGKNTATRVQTIKAPGGDKLRIIVLGGCEEVGRNCTLIEYKNDIIIIDMGLQFPEEDMPGVDYIIPNMSYLKGKEKRIKGVIITHGHLDHIGAIPHVIPNIGNPPVFSLPIAAGIIKRRQEDFHTQKLNLKTIKLEDILKLGSFDVSFFHVNHNIPDSVGVVVKTPVGTVCHTGDWKYDFHPAGVEHADLQKIAAIDKKVFYVCLETQQMQIVLDTKSQKK